MFPALWIVAVIAMVHDVMVDPYDPRLVGTAAYGHNGEDALRTGVLLSLVELALLMAALWPWSGQPSYKRQLAVLVALVPWTALAAIWTMHAGGIFAIHFLWLLACLVATSAMTAWSIMRRVRS